MIARRSRRGWRRTSADVLLLATFVGLVYFLPATDLPIVGEEARRARGAINMLESGDWLVVRQQGIVFPDRPPMSNWLIAVAGWARGSVDPLAIRLPSLLATLATTLLIYFYAVRLDTRLTGLISAASFATFGQVLQLGRLGESEAPFTFFVAASLLLWHLAFSLGRHPVVAFVAGYSCAGLGALVKGVQAPVYFVAATAVFLLLERNWRWLFGWGQWLGLSCFVAIVGAWQVPYYRATDFETSVASWWDVVGPRLGLEGLLINLVAYPLETFACLLPWSVLLLALVSGPIRRAAVRRRAPFTFVVVALLTTYPSVWFSAGAKGRYYMPLYPLAAMLVGMVFVEIVSTEGGATAGRWRRFVVRAAGLAALATLAACLWRWVAVTPARGDLGAAIVSTLALAVLATLILCWVLAAGRDPTRAAVVRVVLVSTVLLGLAYSTLWIDNLQRRRQNLTPRVVALRRLLPDPQRLVSLGPVDPRFAYPYGDFIEETPWPTSLAEVDPDLDSFCFDWRPGDTAESHHVERGMRRWQTPGTLPFAWREIGRVGVGPKVEDPPRVAVIVGRILRDARGRPLPGDQRAAGAQR